MKKYIKYIFSLLLFVMLVFLYGFSSNRNSAKKINKIEIEFDAGNNHFLTHEMVSKLLIQNNKRVKNLPKRIIDLHRLESNVLFNSFVEKATVYLTPSGLLKTTIKQREPIARIVTDKGSFYVDKYGVRVPLSNNFSARVLLVSGVNSPKDIVEITQLVAFINNDSFFKKEIVAIKKNAHKEYEFLVRSGDYKILFGKFKYTNVKFRKLKAFYSKALTDNTIKNYKVINVKYHNQVVCTK